MSVERSKVRPSEALAACRAQVRRALAAAGARHVRIFGSVARGEDTAGSDLDLLAVLPPRTGLIGVSRLALQLEDILGVPVDIVSDRGHGRVLDNARSQAIPL